MSRSERKNPFGRQEVEQHARAYKYLCIENVNQPLTVNLIKETHRILMEGLPVDTNQPINQSINQSVNQTNNQSIKQSIHPPNK